MGAISPRPVRAAAAILLAVAAAAPAAGLGPGGAPAAAGGAPAADAAVRRLAARLVGPASRLRVDGRADDWAGIPEVRGQRGDVAVDRARDIVGVAIAVRAADVVVLVRTAAPPPAGPGTFAIDLDFAGFSARDAEILVAPGGTSEVRLFPERAAILPRTTSVVEARVGEVLEVRLPLLVIAGWFPPGAAADFVSGRRRPWVRVHVRSLDPSGRVVDRGPAAAAFRLEESDGPLDGPPPRAGDACRPVGLPVDGRWLVRQGGHALWSHADHWAYDIAMVDVTLDGSPGADGAGNERYLSWDRAVHAPEPARVSLAHGEEPDREPEGPRAPLHRGTRSNQVVIAFADGLRLFLDHLRFGSVAVSKGDEVAAGALLGRVGNSGASGAPHLHIAAHDRPGDVGGLPLALRDVRVSLNAVEDDPWARDLDVWEVREGFLVERRTPLPRPAAAPR